MINQENKERTQKIEELALDQLAEKLELEVNTLIDGSLKHRIIKDELNHDPITYKLESIFLNKFQKELNLNINPNLDNKKKEELIKKKIDDPNFIDSLSDEILDSLAQQLMLDINDNVRGKKRYELIRGKLKDPYIAYKTQYECLDSFGREIGLDKSINSYVSYPEKLAIVQQEFKTPYIEYILTRKLLNEILKELGFQPVKLNVQLSNYIKKENEMVKLSKDNSLSGKLASEFQKEINEDIKLTSVYNPSPLIKKKFEEKNNLIQSPDNYEISDSIMKEYQEEKLLKLDANGYNEKGGNFLSIGKIISDPENINKLPERILDKILAERKLDTYSTVSYEKKYELIQENIKHSSIIYKLSDKSLEEIAKKMKLYDQPLEEIAQKMKSGRHSHISDIMKKLSVPSVFNKVTKVLNETIFPEQMLNFNLYNHLCNILTKNNKLFFELSEIFDKNFLEKNNLMLKRVHKYDMYQEAFNENKDFLLTSKRSFVELIDKNNSNNSIIIDSNVKDYRNEKSFFIGSKQKLFDYIMNLLQFEKKYFKFTSIPQAEIINDAIFNQKVEEKHCNIIINYWYGKQYINSTTNVSENLALATNSSENKNLNNTPTVKDQNKPTVKDQNTPTVKDQNKPTVKDQNKPTVKDQNTPTVKDQNKKTETKHKIEIVIVSPSKDQNKKPIVYALPEKQPLMHKRKTLP